MSVSFPLSLSDQKLEKGLCPRRWSVRSITDLSLKKGPSTYNAARLRAACCGQHVMAVCECGASQVVVGHRQKNTNTVRVSALEGPFST